jgi:SAM-dependent MidA family methyltransferase
MTTLDAQEASLSAAMRARLVRAIDDAGGRLPFDRYMELALYEPGLGYYVNGRRRLGPQGDFVTAPELSPLFGACVANACVPCLEALDGGDILEFGAGSGRLAVDVLTRLERLDRLPDRYLILEPSPDLQALQAETLQSGVPHLAGRVAWLQGLPEPGIRGVMLANEVLDAMPVHCFRRGEQGDWEELFVVVDGGGFADCWGAPGTPGLVDALDGLWADRGPPSAGYRSEINLRLGPWMEAVAGCLDAGCLLLFDYGYTGPEYYHPERDRGTLICHHRHRAHDDPYALPGLQDMTANVDFSAVAHAARAAGLALAGYTTQANFLIGSGIDRLLADAADEGIEARLRRAQAAKQLMLPSEMGERFKAMALCRAPGCPLPAFEIRDLRSRL